MQTHGKFQDPHPHSTPHPLFPIRVDVINIWPLFEFQKRNDLRDIFIKIKMKIRKGTIFYHLFKQ